MRPSVAVQWTRAVPIASVPASSLRLPANAAARPRPKAVDPADSPTIDRLLSNLGRSAQRMQASGQQPGSSESTAAGSVAASESSAATSLPPNLRINEFVPRRKVYEGVKASHRDLLRRLRREA